MHSDTVFVSFFVAYQSSLSVLNSDLHIGRKEAILTKNIEI